MTRPRPVPSLCCQGPRPITDKRAGCSLGLACACSPLRAPWPRVPGRGDPQAVPPPGASGQAGGSWRGLEAPRQ